VLNAVTEQGATPFHAAVLSGDLETVKAMVESKADFEQQKRDGSNSLHLAARIAPELLPYLLSLKIDHTVVNRFG
jgi:ankyrin repeat protein